MNDTLTLLPTEEAILRHGRLQHMLRDSGIDGMLVSDNATLFYLCGRVYAGYAYLPAEGDPLWFVRRPVGLGGEDVAYIRNPEDIPALLASHGLPQPQVVGLEFDLASYTLVNRLAALFPLARTTDCSAILRNARAVKTPFEIELMRQSGVNHEAVYRKIPGLYEVGMTDHELQVEIERVSRLEGCLGMFRISGGSMEIFMGNVLCGRNADVPTPYDFAMGGGGLNPSLPVGACGEAITEGTAVMVDVNGDFTGYMTDMTRVFSLGNLPALAYECHQCSIDVCRLFEREALPGVRAKELYRMIAAHVEERGLERYFMGHRQHAGFVGHGLGIEIDRKSVV